MEYYKIINLLDKTTNQQPSKSRTKICVETNNDLRGACNIH